MKLNLLGILGLVAIVNQGMSKDCRITYTGIAKDGYKAGKTVSIDNHYYDCNVRELKDLLRTQLQGGSIIYGSSRQTTSKGRLSPIPKYHFMTPSSAKWCLGELTDRILWWDFEGKENDCHIETVTTIAQQK